MKTNYIPEELQRLMHEAFERKRNATNMPLFEKMRISRYPTTEVDQKTEEVRRNTEAHSVESCGGCVGFYNPREWVWRGRDRKGREKSVPLTEEFITHNSGVEKRGGHPIYLSPISRRGVTV